MYNPLMPSQSLLGILRSFRKEFFWVVVFSLVANLLTLSPTLYMLQVFDRVMLSQNEFTLISLSLITALFIGVMAFAEWIRSRLLVRAGVRFDEQLNSRIFLASFAANLDKPRADNAGNFSALTRLRQFLTGNGMIALLDLPWTPIYLAVLYFMHPLLGLFGLVFTLLLGGLALANHRLTSKSLDQAMRSDGKSIAYLAGKLRNAEVVKAMGMQGNFKRRWIGLYRETMQLHSQSQKLSANAQAIAKFVQYAQQSLILALGAWLTIRGEISPGAMVASNVLMSNALRPIGVLVSTWKEFAHARQAFNDIGSLLDTYPEINEGHAPERIFGQLSLKKLSAFVDQREKPILKDLDIRFEAGEVIGIVGPSGAGKSTLARCIVGVWPRTTGSVQLDGIDLSRWSRAALGPHIGYLPQDVELLEGNVAQNICRFNTIDSEAIIEAAKRADIHEMILRLPMGYDTPVGQAGKLLSGGQRQRLALARAIYGLPSLVVLDEPNANLDDAGEAALAAAIKHLKAAGKTVFMVLHQRNLLVLADRVLVMNDGRISQFGKLDTLVTPGSSGPIMRPEQAA